MSGRDIVDTIDQALNDWSVSGDAMRWTPERTTPAPTSITPEQAAAVLGAAVEALTPFLRALGDLAAEFGRSMARVSDRAREVGLLLDAAPTEDARERALWLARHRHTGPHQPPVNRQKRPRRLT